ncbi:MAG TPA: type II secretion system F family protein [Longimicrobium sp.]|nr:type II secretion system F family protein [Longimicrobium sp.]
MTSEAGFAYRAAQSTGAIESGVVRAESAEAARSLLAGRGLFPLELRAEDAMERAGARLPPADLALGLRVFATLLESGLPLARALAAMDELVPASWNAVLPPLRDAVREGKSLAGALAESPVAFPPLVMGLLAAGEAGSGLAAAVTRAAELAEQQVETRRAIQGALAYPILLACAGTASVALLVTFVLPRFAAILADLGQRLPPTARLVLAAADAVRAGWLPALGVAAVLTAAWRLWTASQPGREQWHALLLDLPLVGRARLAAATGRFASALAALLESGVPIAPALAHAGRAAGDAAVEARVRSARDAVLGGQRLSAALEGEGAVTPTAMRLVRAGEETGRLAAMLTQAGRVESARAAQLVQGAVRVIEPTLIVAFGGLVALVAAALLQAVYSVRPVP